MREILKDSVIAKQTTNHEKKHNIHDAKYSNFVTIENQRLLRLPSRCILTSSIDFANSNFWKCVDFI